MNRLTKRRPVNHAAIAAKLRAAPGQWLPVGTYPATYSATSTAHTIRTGGRYGTYKPGGAFEARTERVEDGTSVYARYIGAQSTCSQCPTPVQPGTVYCSTACRNLDDKHDNGEATDGEVSE